MFHDKIESGGWQTARELIARQPVNARTGALRGEARRRAFDAGHISDSGVGMQRALRQLLQLQGIDISEFKPLDPG